MAENQILPFAQGQGANVLSQTDYAGDSMRLQGHQPGVARSALENKALLQSSSIAAGLAQFIADGQAADVTDTKTPVEIAAMLLAAVAAQMPAATNAAAGKVRFATVEEAAAKISNDVALSPGTLNYAFGASGNTIILPNNISFQFVSPIYDAGAGIELTVRETFPFAFTTAPFVIAGVYGDTNAAAGGLTVKAQGADATGFNLIFQRGNSAALNGRVHAAWLAIGKLGV